MKSSRATEIPLSSTKNPNLTLWFLTLPPSIPLWFYVSSIQDTLVFLHSLLVLFGAWPRWTFRNHRLANCDSTLQCLSLSSFLHMLSTLPLPELGSRIYVLIPELAFLFVNI